MRNIIILLLFISEASFAMEQTTSGDSTLCNKIDTTCIESCRKLLMAKVVLEGRYNSFSITDNTFGKKLEYSINSNTNLGFGLNYKGIGVEFQFSPKSLNNDNALYGKSKQFSISTSANGRRFIYDVYLRSSQGFHTTTGTPIEGDTTGALAYYYRSDIQNINLGMECVYLFNNKHFSSSAPYNFTQRQKKSAGTKLLGTFFSLYTIGADSVIFPDSLKNRFKPEVQFKDAANLVWGISFGYTYTFVFRKYWFLNLYALPGLSIQQYIATNAYSEQTKSKVSLGIAFQSRLSFGYNKPRYFFGFAFLGNNYTINNDKSSSLNYKYGSLRFYYGYRFNLRKDYLTRIAK
ncbi:MAG: DUF4421 family protein [Bacteroidota bacterium]